ncbi:MAG: tetratricopeptide repeat-containing sulfotransferase family protein [Gemmataceae bacterium]
MAEVAPTALAEAIAYHQRGELAQAEQRYRAILAAQPDHADALHLLGVLALQCGRTQVAIELMEHAIARQPSNAAYHANLAEAYNAAGQGERAIACCQLALSLQPVYPEAANNLGSLHMRQGRIAEAAALFRRAVQQKPDFAAAHNNLGNAMRLLGDIAQALAHFRRAVELNPQLGFAHGNLGQLLLECERLEDALPHCQEAVRLQPQSAAAHNNLGNVFRRLGRVHEAKACYTEALRRAPNLAMAQHNLGEMLLEEGKLSDAQNWLVQTVQLEPNAPRFHNTLASLRRCQNDLPTAETHLLTALQLDPNYLDARLALSQLRADQGRLPEAQEELQRILQNDAAQPRVHFQLGVVLLEMNSKDEALACFRTVLRLHPGLPAALAQLATYFRSEMTDEECLALDRQLARPQLGDRDRVQLLFALANVCDARGHYQRAAEILTQANALEARLRKQDGSDYNAAAHIRFVDQLLDVFTPDFFERVRGFGLDSERPIFIVGLPRSGTTLLEQVLASHARVFGGGELRLTREDFEMLGGGSDGVCEQRAFDILKRIDAAKVRTVAETHLRKLQGINASAERVTDKMPDNYQYLGFLNLLFPKARLLHCRRDPRDVAVSCWITQFQQIPWTNDQEQIVSRFTQYRRIMAHWKRVLPAPILDVDYEDMVEDLEGTARRVLDFCGLDWQPACLNFHHTERPIRTASLAQVRQPIYKRSVARWKHYQTALQSLFARLDWEESRG